MCQGLQTNDTGIAKYYGGRDMYDAFGAYVGRIFLTFQGDAPSKNIFKIQHVEVVVVILSTSK